MASYPDASTEPVPASLVMTHARTGTVVWPPPLLQTDDTIRVSAALPAAVVVSVEPAELPVLHRLTVRAVVNGRTERVALTVPVDTEYALISAMRTARLTCRVCHRTCHHPYDAATSTAPYFAICQGCDERITGDVRAQMHSAAQTEDAVANTSQP